MGKSKRKWIVLTWENDGCLRAQDIPYDNTQSIRTKIESLNQYVDPGTFVGTISSYIPDGDLYYGDVTHNLGTGNLVSQSWDDTDIQVIPEKVQYLNDKTLRLWYNDNTSTMSVSIMATGNPGRLTATSYTTTMESYVPWGDRFYYQLSHGLNSELVNLTCYDATSKLEITPSDVELIDENGLYVYFNKDPGPADVIVISSSYAGPDTTGDVSVEVNSFQDTMDNFQQLGDWWEDVTHNLGTRPVIVQCYYTSSWETAFPTKVELGDTNSAKIWFSSDPGSIEVIISKGILTTS